MSRSSKGKAAELEAKKILEARGYMVEKSVHTMWQRRDFFNCFDLIAKKKGSCRFIQVKYLHTGNIAIPTTKLPLIDFAKKYSMPSDEFELWVKQAGKWKGRGSAKIFKKATWTIYHIDADGNEVGKEEFYVRELIERDRIDGSGAAAEIEAVS